MLRATFVAVAALLGASCGQRKPLHPVRAEVFFEGRPAAGALVVLHPADDRDNTAIRPSGYVESDGTLKLTSYIAASRTIGNGAPAGDYIVTISWLPTDVKEFLSKHPNTPVPDKLEGKYSQPDRSSLRAKVMDGPTDLPRIDLKKGAVIRTRRSASVAYYGDQPARSFMWRRIGS
jgi:hypothetical protein